MLKTKGQQKIKTRWNIHAYYLDASNCDWGCPCQFNAKPTYGNCDGLSGIHIINGNIDTKKAISVIVQQSLTVAMRQLEDEVEETQREVEHWRSEIQKEKAFYASHGCKFNDNSLWSCPTGTPNYPLQEYIPTKQNN